jgi:hypothetical protein
MKISQLKLINLFCLLVFFIENSIAQLGVNDTNTPPAANAILDVKSATKGMYIPRITTTNRNTLSGEGMVVFDTDTKSFWYHNGTIWVNNWVNSGTNIYNGNTGNVGIGTITPSAKLDVNGTLKYTNGTQGNAKVLTSDPTGNATWLPLPTASGFPYNIPEIVSWKSGYSSATSYSINDLVGSTTANVYYYSLQNTNLNHTPESSPSFWQPVNFYQLKQIYKPIPINVDQQTISLISFPDATYSFRGKILYTHTTISTANGMTSASAETDFNIIKSATSSGSNIYTEPATKFGVGLNGLSNASLIFFISSNALNVTTDVNITSGTPTITSNGIYFRLEPLGGQTGAASTPTTIVLVP